MRAPYDFVVDVGCAHGLEAESLWDYHRELVRLLKPGALYLLFAHLNDSTDALKAQRWLNEDLLRQIFTDGFRLERVDHGHSQMPEQPAWPSGWFWFRRASA